MTSLVARDALTDTARRTGYTNDGLRVSGASAKELAHRIRSEPLGSLLVVHRELRALDVDMYLAFLEACGGFRID